ncbi:MAG: WecB/TagA/CpsF family glycosyltransferase [Nocardioides sp.]
MAAVRLAATGRPMSDGGCRLYGLELAPLTLDEAVELADDAVVTRTRLLIGVLNAAKVVKLSQDRVLRDSLLEADVLLADGQSIVWASRLLRRPLPERVAGIDLFEALLGLADRHRLRVYLLGARPDVLSAVEETIHRRWPAAQVVGSRDGYFAEEESSDVAADIVRSRADLLFLGMTTPKKEVFLGTYGHLLGVPVMHGVGGSFDILAGITRRAPEAWQRAGMEWAYRVLQEPGRLWQRYLTTNAAFLGMSAAELVHRRIPYPRPCDTVTPVPASTPNAPSWMAMTWRAGEGGLSSASSVSSGSSHKVPVAGT